MDIMGILDIIDFLEDHNRKKRLKVAEKMSVGISIESIAGVSPEKSTYADVIRELGHTEIKHDNWDVGFSGIGKARSTYLDYSDVLGISVFFNPCLEVLDESPVFRVMAEGKCKLRTAGGIHVGQRKNDAIISAVCNWREFDQLHPYNGNLTLKSTKSSNKLHLHFSDRKKHEIDCISLRSNEKVFRNSDTVCKSNRSFSVGNHVIIDHCTELMWSKDANIHKQSLNWNMAVAYVSSLNLDGYSDWRLPSKSELSMFFGDHKSDLIKFLSANNFVNIQDNDYWTQSSSILNDKYAWIGDAQYGYMACDKKTSYCYVWPVRG